MSKPPRPLAHKLVVSLATIVVVVATVSGVMRVRALERGLEDTMMVGADQVSRGITSATWHAMLADNRQDAYDIMRAIARQPGISRIRIFNKEGRITFSTAEEAGQVVDKNAEACVLCHASAQPLVRVEAPSRARIFRAADGQRRLAMITPIYNEPSCSTAACHAHARGQNVLGVVDVAMDLDPVDRQVRTARGRVLVQTLLEILLIAAAVVGLVEWLVARPIHRLIEANAAVSRMELENTVEIRSSRELWDLGRSFNAMHQWLKEALAALQRSAQELEAKVDERTEQLRRAHERLLQSERLASLGQLAASVAHEINNPLAGVLNFSALMQRILREDGIPRERLPEFRRYLDRVTEQTARAGHVVSDLLSFSRRSVPHRAAADLNDVVKTTLALVSHKLELANVGAELRLDGGLPAVWCDVSQIQQVVLNLVVNAAEAARPRGPGHVRITTRASEDGRSVCLEVEDDGEGIAADDLPHIFDPFFTTKGEGKGVGLGLAVVYGIVQSHGGQIDVQSTPHAGTVFRVLLPREAPPAESPGSGHVPA